MSEPTLINRLSFWLTLGAPLWLIRKEWFKRHILPRAGVYAYYEDQPND